jgi:hypothetical protein
MPFTKSNFANVPQRPWWSRIWPLSVFYRRKHGV